HPMLASTPASILNHKTAKNGIPSDSTKSGYALERCSFSWKRRTALSFYHAIPGKSASRLASENRCALFLELL
ncbi:hypothetical protein, partial [Rhizobium changzhiense]|uniref:hypothetical protein n=1 Tax=Rhizobium changzhiense TaxID=2692317 RepID=UPI0019D6328C